MDEFVGLQPLLDEDQNAGPGGINDRRVVEPARAQRGFAFRAGMGRLAVAQQIAADGRGVDAFQMREMDVIGLPRVEQVLDRKRSEFA
ncbi:MAG: hypothetical protein WDM86_21335 [Rhizomicrobium sp.]